MLAIMLSDYRIFFYSNIEYIFIFFPSEKKIVCMKKKKSSLIPQIEASAITKNIYYFFVDARLESYSNYIRKTLRYKTIACVPAPSIPTTMPILPIHKPDS